MRLCPSCDEQKDNSSFYKSSRAKSGLQTYCKECHLEKDNDNPARNERYVRYKAKWPGKVTWSLLKKRAEKLGVPYSSTEEFVAWYSAAVRHCVYCGIDETEAKTRFSRNLHIDRKQGPFGYVVGNMVLACRRCNEVKSAHLSHDQMMQVAGMFFGGPVNNHDAMVKALTDLSNMYAHAWDRVDGGLTMFGSGVERFEKAHYAAQVALCGVTGDPLPISDEDFGDHVSGGTK